MIQRPGGTTNWTTDDHANPREKTPLGELQSRDRGPEFRASEISRHSLRHQFPFVIFSDWLIFAET